MTRDCKARGWVGIQHRPRLQAEEWRRSFFKIAHSDGAAHQLRRSLSARPGTAEKAAKISFVSSNGGQHTREHTPRQSQNPVHARQRPQRELQQHPDQFTNGGVQQRSVSPCCGPLPSAATLQPKTPCFGSYGDLDTCPMASRSSSSCARRARTPRVGYDTKVDCVTSAVLGLARPSSAPSSGRHRPVALASPSALVSVSQSRCSSPTRSRPQPTGLDLKGSGNVRRSAHLHLASNAAGAGGSAPATVAETFCATDMDFCSPAANSATQWKFGDGGASGVQLDGSYSYSHVQDAAVIGENARNDFLQQETIVCGKDQQIMKRQQHSRTRRRRRKQNVVVNVTCCRYQVVVDVVEDLGWRVCDDEDDCDWNVFWTDTSVSCSFVSSLQPYQRVNHFPGMFQISRKCDLATALGRMAERMPEAFQFFPETYILPKMASQLEQAMKPRSNPVTGRRTRRTFIVKPTASAQGRGIYLTRNFGRVTVAEPSVCQRYITKPHLIESFKYDLRVYVLVVSVTPLCILMYDEGLMRICTEPYSVPNPRNMRRPYMHLTNYAINKFSEDFVPCTDEAGVGEGASKRSTAWLFEYLKAKGHDPQVLWDDIGKLAVKTVISITPSLAHLHNMCWKGAGEPGVSKCFEVLGFDVMIDDRLKPWLVEVNHAPSFACDSPLDERIKGGLISDTLRLLKLSPFDSRRHRQASAAASRMRLYEGANVAETAWQNCNFSAVASASSWNLGGFSVIYPFGGDPERQAIYEKCLDAAQDLHRHVPGAAASRPRSATSNPSGNPRTHPPPAPTSRSRFASGSSASAISSAHASAYSDASTAPSAELDRKCSRIKAVAQVVEDMPDSSDEDIDDEDDGDGAMVEGSWEEL